MIPHQLVRSDALRNAFAETEKNVCINVTYLSYLLAMRKGALTDGLRKGDKIARDKRRTPLARHAVRSLIQIHGKCTSASP